MITLITLGIITWWTLGIWGFIFWWTTQWDFESTMVPLALVEGVLGPFTWILGWMIHGKGTILIKRRTK